MWGLLVKKNVYFYIKNMKDKGSYNTKQPIWFSCSLLTIVEPMPSLCDFETSNSCGYTQDTEDEFDWSRHKGYTITPDTGPSIDHTQMSSSNFYSVLHSFNLKMYSLTIFNKGDLLNTKLIFSRAL